MITSAQIRNPEVFAFVAVLLFKVIKPSSFVYKQKRQ